MERMTWTDERMDDFAAHTYRRFDAVDRRFDAVERRMEDGFNRVDADLRELRTEMNMRFERVESRIDDINRTMLRLGGGAIATFVVGFAGLIATQL
jgi:hypothetical protein